MTANVLCAGGGFLDDWAYVNDSLAGTSKAKPCGWKGRRGGSFPDDFVQRHPAYYTAKPCPRCGGGVELIPQDTNR